MLKQLSCELINWSLKLIGRSFDSRGNFQTYVEFAREKGILFDKWCLALKASNYDSLRELVLLEDFRKCIPERVVLYLNEQKVSSLAFAAVLADEYVLTHKSSFHVNEKHVLALCNSSTWLIHLFQRRIVNVFIFINLDMSSLTV